MEDYKWVLYVIAAIYFILKARKKKVSSPEEDVRPFEGGQQTGQGSKPITFEDLLREIQQSKVPARPAEPKQTAKEENFKFPKYEDYDDNLPEEKTELENVDYRYQDNDKIYETYEKAKQEAFNRPSLEETLDIKDTVVRFGHFKGYDQTETPAFAQTVASELQNAESFKKAFILSEVFKRKF